MDLQCAPQEHGKGGNNDPEDQFGKEEFLLHVNLVLLDSPRRERVVVDKGWDRSHVSLLVV